MFINNLFQVCIVFKTSHSLLVLILLNIPSSLTDQDHNKSNIPVFLNLHEVDKDLSDER